MTRKRRMADREKDLLALALFARRKDGLSATKPLGETPPASEDVMPTDIWSALSDEALAAYRRCVRELRALQQSGRLYRADIEAKRLGLVKSDKTDDRT